MTRDRKPWGEWRIEKYAGRLTPEIDAALRGCPDEMCPRINRAIPVRRAQVPDDRWYTGAPSESDDIDDACKTARLIMNERDETHRAANAIADERDEALLALEDCRDALDRLRTLADLLLAELVERTDDATRIKADVMAALADLRVVA